MGYYDFEHFWEPHQVCGQENQSPQQPKKWSLFKDFWDQIFELDRGNSVKSSTKDRVVVSKN